MKTRDKDFTGCHPEIAEALKRGKDIKCLLWDDNEREASRGWAIAYKATGLYKYQTKGRYYTNAKPIKTKKIVKPFYELVEQLKKDGYYLDNVDADNAVLCDEGKTIYFNIAMFNYCGKEPRLIPFGWREEWLTEVEE